MSASLQHHHHHKHQSTTNGVGSGGASSSVWSKKKLTPKSSSRRSAAGSLSLDSTATSFSDDDYRPGADETPDPLVPRSPVAYQPLQLPIVHRPSVPSSPVALSVTAVFRALFPPLQMLLPTCRHLSMPSLPSRSMSLGRKRVVGTLYGHRRGRVTFCVQDDPSSAPLLLLELAVATGNLVKEMASGTVRILLESEKQPLDAHRSSSSKKKKKHQAHVQSPAPAPVPAKSLWEEPVWTMFCNGRRSGYAVSHTCGEPDLHVLKTIQAVSAGAGVLPPPTAAGGTFPPAPVRPSTPFLEKGKKAAAPACNNGGGGEACSSLEVMYMRARFERVVGSKDSEAFYMMSPDGGKAGACGGGSPELSIFLLRL